jgi:phosphoribosyl 1,2-cyclic phosphate phosphodiesterase
MSLRFTILGCGSSGGVPRIAGGWGACDPLEPRNRRRRCSALVERFGPDGVTRVLIDTSPDMREQLISAGIDRLDAVAMTHDHADHAHGIDDLRAITIETHRMMPVHMDQRTSDMMNKRFDYIFRAPEGSNYSPIVIDHRIISGMPFRVEGDGGAIEMTPVRFHHGEIDALGFRIGGLLYSPDLNAVPEKSLQFLLGLDLWIVDALRPRPHPSHFSLAEALEWIARVKPKRAILTNLHTDLDYRSLAASLPPEIIPAHDGLALDFGG